MWYVKNIDFEVLNKIFKYIFYLEIGKCELCVFIYKKLFYFFRLREKWF